MKNYFYLIVESTKENAFEELDSIAVSQFGSTGVQEYSIDEARVDEILGDRSYSGGDIPIEVLDEVEQVLQNEKITQKFYFASKGEAIGFSEFLKENFALTIEVQEEEVKDWNEKWKESFSPIHISQKLEIVPSWYEDYQSESENVLKIYPGMGFGTGTHETTYLCLKLLMDIDYNSEDLSSLDFGCGSGILGLALKRLNQSTQIDLYDIDQEALDNCLQNLGFNNMNVENFGLYLPDNKIKISKKYDIVFANILKNILLDEAHFLVNSVSSDLILSGLLNGQEQEVIDEYQELNPKLELVNILRKNDWCAVHMKIK
jgi:ribosomal protein L11 methyltransferase